MVKSVLLEQITRQLECVHFLTPHKSADTHLCFSLINSCPHLANEFLFWLRKNLQYPYLGHLNWITLDSWQDNRGSASPTPSDISISFSRIRWVLVSVILLIRLWGALWSHDGRHEIESLLFLTVFAAIWILNVKSGPIVIKFQMSLITLQNSPTSSSTNALWTSSAGKPAQRSQEKIAYLQFWNWMCSVIVQSVKYVRSPAGPAGTAGAWTEAEALNPRAAPSGLLSPSSALHSTLIQL